MDAPRDDHTKTEKDRYHMRSLMGSNFLKIIQMNLFIKQKKTYRYQNQTFFYRYQKQTFFFFFTDVKNNISKGEMLGGGKNQELEMNIHTTTYETDNQQGPTV